MKTIKAGSNEAGQRLDKLLMKVLSNASKGFIYKMLRKKNIKLNGKKAAGNETVLEGDVIDIYLSDETMSNMSSVNTPKPCRQNFEIIYEDSEVIAVNKPVGVLTQSSGDGSHSLNDMLLYRLYKREEYDPSKPFTPSICNRLDRNTSGIVVMGKTLNALQELNKAFKEKNTEKLYLALVKGTIVKNGHIEGKQTKKDNYVSIDENMNSEGIYASTFYEPVKSANDFTLLRIKLETGRSHQIRVALASIGHPIAGDPKYGDRALNNILFKKYGLNHQLLHAYELKISCALDGISNTTLKAEPDSIMKRILKETVDF